MTIVLDIISIIFQAFFTMLDGIISAIIQNLPVIFEIKKIAEYFMPAGLLGLYLGIPVILITILLFILKKAIRKR